MTHAVMVKLASLCINLQLSNSSIPKLQTSLQIMPPISPPLPVPSLSSGHSIYLGSSDMNDAIQSISRHHSSKSAGAQKQHTSDWSSHDGKQQRSKRPDLQIDYKLYTSGILPAIRRPGGVAEGTGTPTSNSIRGHYEYLLFANSFRASCTCCLEMVLELLYFAHVSVSNPSFG